MNKSIKIGVITGIISGLFGSGGGSYLVPKLEENLGFTCKKAHASSIAIILPTTIFSILIYLLKVDISIINTLCISLGGVIGGSIGSKRMNKIKSKNLNKFFSIMIMIIGIKLIL